MTAKEKQLTLNLFLLTFVLGTSEFVIVGLLNEISADLNIALSTAGATVSAFALSFAIGTPVLTAIFSRFSKYPLMLILIAVFITGNVITALSGTYTLLILSRILTAIVTGVLIALAMSVASETIPAAKRGKVIAIIFAGFTVASVIGVPLGTFIGQWSGWHSAFWFTSLLGIISLISCSITIPKRLHRTKGSLVKQVRLLGNPRILIAFFIPTLSIAATYTVYTYLTPLMKEVLLVQDRYISLVFLLYGVVSLFSTLLGGKIAARNGIKTLRYAFLLQAVILASLYVSSHSIVTALISISFMALVVYIMNSTMQLYFIDLADKHYPAAKDLASSLNPVSINVGIALGSSLGGFAAANMRLIDVSWIGGFIAVAASLMTFISYLLGRRSSPATDAVPDYAAELERRIG
ncbi:MFS transporter [Paenibacillus sp. GXUN7292]|uniref:MFS transporter n=1 Tax=Paenibacillus sp. GXUN7292 TaxID=3422499 RepID=UPI003D7E1E5E